MTRRAFLSKAVAIGFSIPAAAALLEACASSGSLSPEPTPGSSSSPGRLPEILPAPATATYGEATQITGVACRTCPPGALAERIAEIAEDVDVPLLVPADVSGPVATVDIAVGSGDLPSQGYRLDVRAGEDPSEAAVGVRIEAADEAGAFYALVSLGQLITSANGTRHIRLASVSDTPGFAHRGVILDVPTPATGSDRLELLSRVRVGVSRKMNLLSLPLATPNHSQPDATLLDYCRAHFVEVLSMIGYQDWLTGAPGNVVKSYLDRQLDLGIRSFSFNWDDMAVTDPEAQAASHAAVLVDVDAYLRSREPEDRIFATLPPYGGIPGVNLVVQQGEQYLAAIRHRIPPHVEVFWTGDGGVFSDEVTTSGAQAYIDAISHPVALWDNNALWWAGRGQPPAGRGADLATVVHTYMGNLVGDELWQSDNARRTMLALLEYAWNPAEYALPPRITPVPSAMPQPQASGS